MLEIVHPADMNHDILVRMQRYISTTPPEVRCPWTPGIVRNTIQELFHEWNPIPALEFKATRLAEIDADTIQLELKRHRIEHKWLEKKTSAEHR